MESGRADSEPFPERNEKSLLERKLNLSARTLFQITWIKFLMLHDLQMATNFFAVQQACREEPTYPSCPLEDRLNTLLMCKAFATVLVILVFARRATSFMGMSCFQHCVATYCFWINPANTLRMVCWCCVADFSAGNWRWLAYQFDWYASIAGIVFDGPLLALNLIVRNGSSTFTLATAWAAVMLAYSIFVFVGHCLELRKSCRSDGASEDSVYSRLTTNAHGMSQRPDSSSAVSADDRAKAEQAKGRGNAAFQAGRFAEAVDEFSTAISLNPSEPVFYSNRSGAYASMPNGQEALHDADRCIAISSTFAKGWSRQGAALDGLGRLADAKRAYEQGLKLDPANAHMRKALADLERRLSGRP